MYCSNQNEFLSFNVQKGNYMITAIIILMTLKLLTSFGILDSKYFKGLNVWVKKKVGLSF